MQLQVSRHADAVCLCGNFAALGRISIRSNCTLGVMPALVASIRSAYGSSGRKTWMPGTRLAMTPGVPISSESGLGRRLESSESFLRRHPEGTSPSGASSPAFPTGKINSYFSIFFRKNMNQNNAAIIENRLVAETKYLSGRFGSMYPSNHVPTFQPTLQRRQRTPVLEHCRESAMLRR